MTRSIRLSVPLLLRPLNLIEAACRRSLPLLSELPFDERDAKFRAIIAKWDTARPSVDAP
jgi:hypothetical protein